ncbi:MAG: leucyl aminopeptidase family protein, partial [Alphaproteobacteria bacterium]
MSDVILKTSDQTTVPVYALSEAELESYLASAPDFLRVFAASNAFKAKMGQVLSVPGPSGADERILFGVGGGTDPTIFRALAAKLTAGDYELQTFPSTLNLDDIVLAFGLGSYGFDRYKHRGGARPKLLAQGANIDEVAQIVEACALARDMTNTPASDLGPFQIETIARDMAAAFKADISVIIGDDLLTQNYPA